MADTTAERPAAKRAERQVAEVSLATRLGHNRNWLGFWYMLPAAALLLFFLAYPLVLGVYMSMTDARIGADTWTWVGFKNFAEMLGPEPLSDTWRMFRNEIFGEWLVDDTPLSQEIFFNDGLRDILVAAGYDPATLGYLDNWGIFWDAKIQGAADRSFYLSFFFTMVYTAVASVLKFAIGLWLALLLNHHLPFKAFLRAIVLLPFIVPTVLSAIAFQWIYDPFFSIINWTFSSNIDFLGDAWNARWSLIAANIWRGVPFVAITLLAGLQTVSPSLYEAARIDGASRWQIFRYITFPLLTPIIAVVMTFSVLFTFTDFQLVWVLTRGAPAETTHLMATLAYVRSVGGGGELGQGAAIATAMIPFLLLAIMISWFGLQRRKWQQGESDD